MALTEFMKEHGVTSVGKDKSCRKENDEKGWQDPVKTCIGMFMIFKISLMMVCLIFNS